jgi:putative ABC transport system substrate-binding protein
MPVVGVPDGGSAEKGLLVSFRQGLAEPGYVEGQNVELEYRWAEGRYDRLPELAANLVRHQVSVIAVPSSTPASLVAKATTTTIPIVFSVGDDPVRLGLVASLARPGGNATGINFFIAELAAKRLGLLHELVPGATRVAVLVNPTDAIRTESNVRDVEAAARALGLQFHVFNASTVGDIDATFTTIVRERLDALFVVPDVFFGNRRVQLATLAARHAIPAAYAQRDYVEVGGLMIPCRCASPGWYLYRPDSPAELPVTQPTRFELAINLTTAKALGLTIPPTLLARADEVIE